MINDDYEIKKSELEKINSDIKELENNADELSFEEKDKLNALKRKVEEKQAALDKSYRDAKEAVQNNLDDTLDGIKNG